MEEELLWYCEVVFGIVLSRKTLAPAANRNQALREWQDSSTNQIMSIRPKWRKQRQVELGQTHQNTPLFCPRLSSLPHNLILIFIYSSTLDS